MKFISGMAVALLALAPLAASAAPGNSGNGGNQGNGGGVGNPGHGGGNGGRSGHGGHGGGHGGGHHGGGGSHSGDGGKGGSAPAVGVSAPASGGAASAGTRVDPVTGKGKATDRYQVMADARACNTRADIDWDTTADGGFTYGGLEFHLPDFAQCMQDKGYQTSTAGRKQLTNFGTR